MQNQNYQHLSMWRLVAYTIVVILLAVQWLMHLTADSWLGLLDYGLFFLATLTLCQSKRRTWLLAGLLVIVILATVLMDCYAFMLSTEMATAMLAMKIMTMVTIVQNVVFSLYFFWAAWFLLRENNKINQLLGCVIVVSIAVHLLPAIWFTLQFISTM